MLDRQHLAILRELDRRGSLTAAAAALNVTQPAVSHLMRKLEARHGVALWEREGRGLRLTPAGEHLLGVARRVLPQIEAAERALADFAAGRRGRLRVGMECHPCEKWLARVTGPYLRAWPEVEFDMGVAFRFGALDALLTHEIDVMITPDPAQIPEARFTPVFDYELVIAVAPDHPLAGAGRIGAEDFAGEVLITYPVAVDRLDIFTRLLLPAGIAPRAHRTVETTEVMLQMVAAGRGISAVPDWLLKEDETGRSLVPLRVGDGGIAKSVHVGMRTGEEGAPHLAGFLSIAAAEGAKRGA
ncbi:LysR family transcriptional regulator [Rhodovulum sp. DZ06]|uniref:LysR family transcriptional regulator n=1 Tax=Rhodovulum sp. DZ06 TaxID=3425126 RepID=UPI003D3577E9